MTRAMRAAGGPAGLAAAAAVFLCVGCKQAEQRIGQSRPLAPEWVLRTPTDTDDLKFYVGRAVAVNALDERRAMNKAMDDAIEQIARSVEVRMRTPGPMPTLARMVSSSCGVNARRFMYSRVTSSTSPRTHKSGTRNSQDPRTRAAEDRPPRSPE